MSVLPLVHIPCNTPRPNPTHLRVGVVTSPVRSDARLTAQVPDLEVDVFVRHRLDVESDGYGVSESDSVYWR
jgi:hypothetical protein